MGLHELLARGTWQCLHGCERWWHECKLGCQKINVSLTTLRDRLDGRVDIDIFSSGAPSLFTQEEEAFIVEHVKAMAEIWYGCTRAEVINLESDFTLDLGMRDSKKPLTTSLYYNFMKRLPELHTVKPSGLSKLRAKAASPECINSYFTEVDKMSWNTTLKTNFVWYITLMKRVS